MYYRSAQTIRKGPRMMGMGDGPWFNNPHCYNGYGAYGASWEPKQKRLDQCPEMAAKYDEWLAVMQEKKRKCKWPYLGPCAKDYRKEQTRLENEGKAAWDYCKGQTKVAQAEVSSGVDIVDGTIVPILPGTTVTSDGGSVTNTGEDPYYDSNGDEEEEDMTATYMIMGLVGGGALLLLLLLKK